MTYDVNTDFQCLSSSENRRNSGFCESKRTVTGGMERFIGDKTEARLESKLRLRLVLISLKIDPAWKDLN